MATNQYKPVTFANRDQNVFLTAASGGQAFKKGKIGVKSTDENGSMSSDVGEVQILRKNIIEIVLQFKSLPKPIQLTHQFNQILYSLDTHLIEKKTVGNIISSLEAEANVIKLARLYNRLRGLGKALEKVKLQNQPQKQIKKASSAQGFRKHILTSHSQLLNTTSQTLPNQSKDNQEWKQQIINQIQYRERIQKFQSQSKKHSLNKEQFIKKKLQKVKDMNKKANEIYQKNKKLHKQRINKYKYQQLFDPEHIRLNIKRRAKMMNLHSRQAQCQETSQLEIDSDEYLTEPISNIKNVIPENNNNTNDILFSSICSKNSSSRNDLLKFTSKLNNESPKTPKISALISLTEIVNPNIKGFVEFQNTNKQQQPAQKAIIHQTKINSYYCTPTPKSFSLDRTLNTTFKKNHSISSKREQQKLHFVKEKKKQLEEQKFNKMIAQAVQKQKRILKIYKKRNIQSKTKKNSPRNQHQQQNSGRSVHGSSSKGMFKKVNLSKNEQLDKQRQILQKIESKLSKKDLFLQQRVNKVRERLQQQQETLEKYKQHVNEYISLTESASAFQNTRSSPIKKLLKNRQVPQQQSVIKCAYQKKQKQSQDRIRQKKLDNLSLNDLRKELIKFQHEEMKASSQNFVF